MADVVVELSGKEILRVALKGPSMTIGRDPSCDLHLDNRALSRRHAQIEKRGAAIWVRDLQSANGTYVNGGRIQDAQALNGGDVVEVGRYQIRIEGADDARADTPVLTLTGPEGRHRFAMVGDEIIIGRAPSCDIAIGHKSISRRHLRIARDGDDFVAEDLGSQNGTRINAKKINGPTVFHVGDKVHMSDFIIEVGYLDQGHLAGPDKPTRTMMLDRSELAKAAYVEGDGFVGVASNAANIAVGQAQEDGRDDDEGDDVVPKSGAQTAAPAFEPEPAAKPRGRASGGAQEHGRAPEARAGDARGAEARMPETRVSSPRAGLPRAESRHTEAPRKSKQATPWVTVAHGDEDEGRDIQLVADVTVIGEDGTAEDGSHGRSYADQGYVVLMKTAGGVVAVGAGDRRLISVNGKACLHKTLASGDVVEFGLLSVVFHLAG